MNQHIRQPKTAQGWASWSIRLKQLGLGGLATSLFEAGKPLAPIAAQLLHIANPLLPSSQSRQDLHELALHLEEGRKQHD